METSFRQAAGGRLLLELWPRRGAPLLFYPGSMLEPGHYRFFLNELSKAGFSVCGLHLPGHGKNETGLTSFEDLLSLGRIAENWLENHFGCPVTLCGHSQGGILAMAHLSEKSRAAACFSICSVYPLMANAIKITRFTRFAAHSGKIRAIFGLLAKLAPALPVPLPVYLSLRRLLAGRKLPFCGGAGKGRTCYSAKFLNSLFSADIAFPLNRPYWLISAKDDGLFPMDITAGTFSLANPPEGGVIWLEEGGHLAIFNPGIAAFVAGKCAAIMAGRGCFLALEQNDR